MAEQVNQRIEDMIGELEQMRRTDLYKEEELREIARKRKEFEYKIQRRVKAKEDFIHYIAYEIALLEDIALRRKQTKVTEKKREVEYAIARRVNKVFKQFIYRFQNDIEIYFQYIKFCQGVGFGQSISGAVGEMLQMYGDNPKMWQMASKWENDAQNNPKNARDFLLKGIHRHPESDILYLDLFKIELLLASKMETDEEKEKQLKRAGVVWRTGMKNVQKVTYLFQVFEVATKYDITNTLVDEIKKVIWEHNKNKDVWAFVASKELEGCHFGEIEEFADEDLSYSAPVKYFMGVYEEALQRFPDQKLCTKYIHELLGLTEATMSGDQKVKAVRAAWMFSHDHGVLSGDMYTFGLKMFKLEKELTKEEMLEILDSAIVRNPTMKQLWEEKLLLTKPDENTMLMILHDAIKALKSDEDKLYLWNLTLDNIESNAMIKTFYKKFQNCENTVVMAIKPRLLQKMYQHNGLKAARDLYEEFIRTPPIQLDVHEAIIEIEKLQDKINVKQVRKCYEDLVLYHGVNNIDCWTDYMQFELNNGSAQLAPAIYRRAVGALRKDMVDSFIKAQTLSKIN